MFKVNATHSKRDGMLPIEVAVRPDGAVLLRSKLERDPWQLPTELAAALSDEIRRCIMAKVVKLDTEPDALHVARNLTVAAALLHQFGETLKGERRVVIMELAARVTHASDVLYAFLDGKDLPKCDG